MFTTVLVGRMNILLHKKTVFVSWCLVLSVLRRVLAGSVNVYYSVSGQNEHITTQKNSLNNSVIVVDSVNVYYSISGQSEHITTQKNSMNFTTA